MTAGAARLVMALATRWLSGRDRAWAQAMQAEFAAALHDGRPLGFALGCLMTAWRRMPLHREGRFALTSHALALGLIVPIATFHLGCALSGLRFMRSGNDPYHAVLAAGGASGRVLADAYRAATPSVTILLLLLGLVHLLIAWAVLERRWRRAAILWATAAAIAATILAVIVPIVPDAGGIAVQLAALAIELTAIPLLAVRARHLPVRSTMEVA